MTLVLTEIEQRIVAALQEFDASCPNDVNSDAVWTRKIKDVVGQIGVGLGFRPFAACCTFEQDGEWMFDLCWCREVDGMLVEMPLAMEIEWTPRGVLEDFQKLLVSRARHRVMITWHANQKSWDACVAQVKSQIQHFEGTSYGDRYLLVGWIDKPESLQFTQVLAQSISVISQ